METLSPGEKIKKLRLELGLNQEDLTNEKVSKSLISMIEKNKRRLTWNTAVIIADSLNKYYKTMGKEITADYLMETEVDLVRKEVDLEMEELKVMITSGIIDPKLFNLTFEKIINLINQWDMKKEMVELHLLKGKFYYYRYEYNKALEACSDVLEYYIQIRDYNEVAYIYNMMGACYYMQMMIEQALTYYTKAYDTSIEHCIENKNKVKIKAFLNLVICYRKIQRYDMALQYIKMYKDVDWEHDLVSYYNIQSTLLEANTYRDLKNYDRAKKLYDKLVLKEKELDKNTLFLIYDNYSISYMEQRKISKALSFVEKAFKIKGVSSDYIPWIYVTKAKCLLVSEKYDQVLITLRDGLVLAEEIGLNEMIIDFHFTLAQTYIMLNDYQGALSHLEDAEKIIMTNDIKVKKNDLYSFYIEVYLGLGESKKSIEYAVKIRKGYLVV